MIHAKQSQGSGKDGDVTRKQSLIRKAASGIPVGVRTMISFSRKIKQIDNKRAATEHRRCFMTAFLHPVGPPLRSYSEGFSPSQLEMAGRNRMSRQISRTLFL